jgi:small nuclear ribonucleoprotein (snRNP)-like protein
VVELKNDLSICGTLHSVDQYLNIKVLEISRDAPDIRPFLISGIRPDTRLPCRISGYCLADPIIDLVFLQIRQEKKFAQKLI